MTVHSHLYASTEYIQRHGAPQAPEELDSHRLIAYTEPMLPPFGNLNWLIDVGAKADHKRQAVFTVNSVYGIFRAVQTGLGIASLPDYMVGPQSGLQRLLPKFEGPRLDAYFVYPKSLRQSKRIAVFRDFLVQQISSTPF